MPMRIQRRRAAGWRMPKGSTYVGRPTRWGNPYRVEPAAPQIVTHPDGSWWTVRSSAHAYVVGEYRADLVSGRLDSITVADVVRELQGRDLVCWCPLSQPCHADVLLELANAEGVAR